MTGLVTSRDGTRIAYETVGASGPSVILIDGAFCSRAMGPMPRLARELAARGLRAITYDRRARGDSTDTKPYAIDREVEDINALIWAAGGRAHLYGVSSGAALALAAASTSMPVEKLALFEPPYMVGPHARELPANHTATLAQMIEQDRHGDAVKFYMCDIIGMPRFLPFVFRFTPMWRKLRAVAPSLPYDSAIMGTFELPAARAAAIRVPTLVLNGEKTWPVLRDAAAAIGAAIPGARRHTLAGQSHNVAASAVAPVLESFFKTNAVSA
jgi:pimeloyl-ACP methyl ester carboxylesterase